ncbi:MAG: S-adenosylmethionine:tRNA ribosyltransferase-isomerase [Candidatus Promineifilaceae bacterium]
MVPLAPLRPAPAAHPRLAPAPSLDFELPAALEAAAPPEARGLARDRVRLLVSDPASDRVAHAAFRDLPSYLTAGDVVVINTSATLPAAVPARRADGSALELRLSSRTPAGGWTAELRRLQDGKSETFYAAEAGEWLSLPAGGRARLLAPFSPAGRRARLWTLRLDLPGGLESYLAHHGRPIRYNYVPQPWPLAYYQTVYATEAGSAEMPSAGRAFTPEIITQLVAKGVQVAPLLLHTGVASLEAGEPPYPEYYRLPPATAAAVNFPRAHGRRVLAVGTTVVRALETAASSAGRARPGEGWTDLLVEPGRCLRLVNALLTGFHDPQASHLAMLEALAGRRHVALAYVAALRGRYLWHEFGDLHLIGRWDFEAAARDAARAGQMAAIGQHSD